MIEKTAKIDKKKDFELKCCHLKDFFAGFAARFLSSLPLSDVSLPDLTVILSARNNVISE